MDKQILSALDYGISKNQINDDALVVIKKLNKHGFDAYIVGGSIRDLLIGQTPKDFDIVTNATPEMIRRVFRRNAIIIGRRFKIVHVVFEHQVFRENLLDANHKAGGRMITKRHVIEISTYRSSEVNEGALNEHGRIMLDNNYGGQQEDSTRRDFTVNALFYDPIKEIIVDYHRGIEDIQARIIRIIGDPFKRYKEDPVRILRAIRLSAKLNMQLAPATDTCFSEVLHLLVNEHKWRLYEEMLKILMSGNAVACVEKFRAIGLPYQVFPLFDDTLLSAVPDEMALQVLIKTDERIRQGNDVSPIFILAGLMWNKINIIWQKLIKEKVPHRQALVEAIFSLKSFAIDVGIVRHTYNNMTEVWLLQYDFDFPNAKRVHKTAQHRRFRQALHLYNLRYEYGQGIAPLNQWWEQFVAADEPSREVLLTELPAIAEVKPKPKKKRAPKKK